MYEYKYGGAYHQIGFTFSIYLSTDTAHFSLWFKTYKNKSAIFAGQDRKSPFTSCLPHL